MIGRDETITENSCSEIIVIMYCPHCGVETHFHIDEYKNDIPDIIFCINCGKQI